MTKRGRQLAAAITGATAVLALASTPAAAGDVNGIGALAGPCGSSYNHVGHHPIKASGVGVVGYFDVYWSTSTKRNCLVVNASGPAYGYRAIKQATIKFSYQSDAFYQADGAIDVGFYDYYAGPVYTMSGINGSGKCIDVLGRINYPGGRAVKELKHIHCS